MPDRKKLNKRWKSKINKKQERRKREEEKELRKSKEGKGSRDGMIWRQREEEK